MEARFPHAVLYGPEIFGGFGWKHPYFLQEIKHAIVLIEESVNKASQTGQLLRQIAELFRVDLGIDLDLTMPSKFFLQYAPSCWYSDFWKFTSKFHVEIVEDYPTILLLWESDVNLMKEIVRAGFQKKDLIRLNHVCKYLKVVSLADIATIDGTAISSMAYICLKKNGF